jgi:hypothetical protein
MARQKEERMSGYKKGDIVNYRGVKTVVASLNADGTVTLNYAAGSGKTGFAGKVPAVKSEYSRTAFTNLIKETEAPAEDGIITLDFYNASIDRAEEATLNGYSRGRSDLAQKMGFAVKRQLRATPNDEALLWLQDRLKEIEDSEYVTVNGEVSPYKTISIDAETMKPYNAGHGVGMRDLRQQIDNMTSEYLAQHPEAKASIENFNTLTAAEKKVEPVKKRSTEDKTPQDYLRLARYMYKETINQPGVSSKYYGYKKYLAKVMHHYGLTSPEASELITGNLSNERGKDPEPKVS